MLAISVFACCHWAPELSVLMETKPIALAGTISAPGMLELPPDEDALFVLLLLPPQAANTSEHASKQTREREMRRI
jgi:hypothetical protein